MDRGPAAPTGTAAEKEVSLSPDANTGLLSPSLISSFRRRSQQTETFTTEQ
jgi:hypothetical protein